MGTPLGPKYIPYTYMDPLGYNSRRLTAQVTFRRTDSDKQMIRFAAALEVRVESLNPKPWAKRF